MLFIAYICELGASGGQRVGKAKATKMLEDENLTQYKKNNN